MESVVQSINLIAVSSTVRNGRPCIIGTTVTVADVVIARVFHFQDADGIAGWYQLTLSQVYAALAYYYEHKPAIDEQIRQQIRRAEDLAGKRIGNEGSLLSGRETD
jgi:uncharacterized protein (DUF433 family)